MLNDGESFLVSQQQFSDEEEEVKRVVRSTKEKRYEELSNLIKTIRNHRKIKDMASILQSFEDLTRAYQKALPVISKEENGVTPRFFVRALAELEDFINEVWEDREGRKNLSKNNGKALGTLRQKVRKYIKDFENDLAKFRESPDDGDDDEEEEKVEEESESSEDEQPVVQAKAAGKEVKEKKPSKYQEDSDDSIDWGSDSDSDSDSSEEEAQYINIRERFLKKATDKDDKEIDDEKRKSKKTKGHLPKKQREDDDDDGEWETVTKGSATTAEKPKMFAKDAEIDIRLVLNKLNEVSSVSGVRSESANSIHSNYFPFSMLFTDYGFARQEAYRSPHANRTVVRTEANCPAAQFGRCNRMQNSFQHRFGHLRLQPEGERTDETGILDDFDRSVQ